MIEINYSIDEIDIIASKKIIPKIKNNIVCFEGRMGSGKTTFIKSICNNLDVVDKITSPTFSLINEYKTLNDCLFITLISIVLKIKKRH